MHPTSSVLPTDVCRCPDSASANPPILPHFTPPHSRTGLYHCGARPCIRSNAVPSHSHAREPYKRAVSGAMGSAVLGGVSGPCRVLRLDHA
eukprot:346835-Chlamydomonas_euryale.AAC.1